jgi:hypothetical protein
LRFGYRLRLQGFLIETVVFSANVLSGNKLSGVSASTIGDTHDSRQIFPTGA